MRECNSCAVDDVLNSLMDPNDVEKVMIFKACWQDDAFPKGLQRRQISIKKMNFHPDRCSLDL